jgi:hypothetical protein
MTLLTEALGDGVTLGDADFRKSPMKMIYRKFPKTASLPVTCHRQMVVEDRRWVGIAMPNLQKRITGLQERLKPTRKSAP